MIRYVISAISLLNLLIQLSGDADELLSAIDQPTEFRKSLMRAEYRNNPEHLRQNMRLLYDRVIKEEKTRRERATTRMPHNLKLETSESVDEYLLSCSFGDLLRLAKTVSIFSGDETEFIVRYDELYEGLKRHLVKLVGLNSRASYSINKIGDSLPFLPSSAQVEVDVQSDNCAIVPSMYIVSKACRHEGLLVEEIGLLCSGYFSWEPALIDEEQQFTVRTCGFQLARHSQAIKGSKKLIELLNNPSPRGISSLVFLFGGNQFLLSLGSWQLSKVGTGKTNTEILASTKQVSYGTYAEQQDEGEQNSVPFFRVALQLQVEHNQFVPLVSKLAAEHQISETAEVLADAIIFQANFADQSSEKRLQQLQQCPSLQYHLSDSLRKSVFTSISTLLDDKWKDLLILNHMYDPVVFHEAKNILFELIVAGKDQSRVALVTDAHLHHIVNFIKESTKHLYKVCYRVWCGE